MTSPDPILRELLDASHDAPREDALARLVTERAGKTIEKLIRRAQLHSGFQPEDVEDLRATIVLRLVQRLTALANDTEREPIRSFDDFVATTSFHAIDDLLRKRYPRRTLLKNRIRYLLANDDRFALRPSGRTSVACLTHWRSEMPAARKPAFPRTGANAVMLDQSRTADAVQEVLTRTGAPLELDDLVSVMAELWQVGGASEPVRDPEAIERLPDSRPHIHQQLEARQTLALLWQEILELPVNQRLVLLLNLREEAHHVSAVPMLIFAGVADLDQIAAAVEMTRPRLEEIWDDLPLDDNRIAAMLRCTRQQVINLRKSARERLARRRAKKRF